jgi:hypothetical protein
MIGSYFECKIWEAARATSAQPLFFKPVMIGPPGFTEEFIGGGLDGNNPIRQVLDQAYDLYPKENLSCILSIGTGKVKPARYDASYIPKDLISTLIGISTNCEATAVSYAWQFQNILDLYFRFNIEQGLQDVALDDWNRLGEVRTFIQDYLQGPDQSIRLKVVARVLHNRDAVFPVSHLCM